MFVGNEGRIEGGLRFGGKGEYWVEEVLLVVSEVWGNLIKIY